jgi:hypothetical protein
LFSKTERQGSIPWRPANAASSSPGGDGGFIRRVRRVRFPGLLRQPCGRRNHSTKSTAVSVLARGLPSSGYSEVVSRPVRDRKIESSNLSTPTEDVRRMLAWSRADQRVREDVEGHNPRIVAGYTPARGTCIVRARGIFTVMPGSSPGGEGSPTNCTRSVQSRRPVRMSR